MATLSTAKLISFVHILLVVVVVSATKNGETSRLRVRKSSEDVAQVAQPQKRDTEGDDDDQYPAETGYHADGGGVGDGGKDHSRGAKYFMYAHQPSKKQYEFGYKRGNDHHVIERYEKAGPKHNFKTKVRWHDAHGGHGEQYWDYNHAPKHEHNDDHQGHHGDHGHEAHGHGHGHGDGHGHNHGYGHSHGHHSEPVPSIVRAESKTSMVQSPDEHYLDSDVSRSSKLFKRSGVQKRTDDVPKKSFENKLRSKNIVKEATLEDQETPSVFPEALGYDPYVPPVIANGAQAPFTKTRNSNTAKVSEQPRSYAKKKSARRSKKPVKTSEKEVNIPKLAYDLDTGRVYDENTKTWFKLVPT